LHFIKTADGFPFAQECPCPLENLVVLTEKTWYTPEEIEEGKAEALRQLGEVDNEPGEVLYFEQYGTNQSM
jgi:hypothetical protein